MNPMMNSGFRMPPPSNQIRPTFPQGGYQPNPNATPYHGMPQQFISVQQPPQHIYYPPNGVRNPAPMQYQHVQQAAPAASSGGYNTYAPAAAASLQAASSAQPQQSIYQQPFFAGGQHFSYAARGPGGQYQYLVQPMPPGANLVHQPGTFMPGGMTPHTGQPTPMPNPGGAPMPGGPPIPPQQQQQPNRPPHQQVQIPASVPPPSSTPSQLPPQVPVSISSTGISVSAASFQPQQPLPPSLVQPHVAQQQIAVTQPPPSLAKREKKILQFINPETGRSIFNNGAAAAAAAASTPSVNASGPPPSVAVTKESATAENEKPESVAPKQMQQSVPSTDIKEATPPPPSGPPPTRGSGEINVNAHPQDKEMLSVAVENKRDDQGLYEPVSPTPLPDSPVEENKGVATAPATKSQDKSLQDDDSHNSELAKQRKKKLSTGQRRAELNRKGEEKERKGGDMLDVFKVSDSQSEPAPKQSTPEVSKPGGGFKEPTPPVSVAPTKEATPPSVTEKAASSAAASREPTPLMSESSKHASPEHFNHKSETVKVNGVGSSEKADKMDNNSGDKLSTPANHIQEVEEGEIIDDTDEGSIGGLEFKLKYKYNEEQWSPLNLAGKKQYEREFLIQLQYDEMSQIKPENLPDMDIIKDKPMRRDIPRASYNFEPSYIKSSVSQSRGHGGPGGHGGHGVGKRPSKSKEPVRRINIPSYSQNVELRKSDKAWKPGVAADKKQGDAPGAEGDDLEELKKKVRAILNKLTPQKFETLVKQFQELPIDKKEKMESAMELVFEKAVDEPAFSVAYAQMCHNLAQREINDGDEKVKFRTILIRRVQKEFDHDYMKDVDMELKKKSEDTSVSEEERKRAREEFETQERKARKRSLGNIRFIGELYNLQLLTLNIMHDCVNKLISKTDEESLECLCKLITTVGSQFDKETNVVLANQKEGKISNTKMVKSYPSVRAISVYFDRMHFIIEKRTTSSRVRFLMQDVIDLKKASWKKRREEAGPKKIDQIHQDMKKEEMFQSLNNQNTMSMPKQRDSMGPPSGDARKRSQKTPQTDSDGWTVPTRAARNTLDKVDTNKIKNMQSRNLTDVDTISLAPKTGGWGQWGKGASSSRNSSTRQEQEVNTGNRFGAFVSSEGSSNSPYEGRTSGGYDRGGYEGRSSSGYGGRSMGDRGGPRPGSYVGRSSRGQSSEQEKAIQAVKKMHPPGSGPGGRSVSTIMPDRSSRTSVPSKSASMRINSKSRDVEFQGNENEDEDKLKMLSESRVNEFLSTKDYKEAQQSIREKFHSTTVHVFIEKSLEFCLEKRLEEIKLVGLLFSSLLKEGIVTEEKFIRGLSFILEIGGDLEVDIPKFWDTLAAHLVASVMDGHLSLNALMVASRTKEPVVKNRGKFLAAVLHGCKGESESRVGQVWADSGLDLATCLSETGSQDIESFIRDNKLEFLWNSGAGRGPAAAGGNQSSHKPLAASGFDAASFCKELRDRLKADSSKVVNFVNDRSKDRQNPDFVQGLVTTLAEHCIDGLGGPVADVKLKEEPFAELCMDVLKSLDFSTEEEMQCIFAIQMLATKLEHPTGLFFNMLNKLYESDVVSFPAAKAWKEDSKADNQRGKGVCVSSCNHLLIEMQMEYDEGENDMETN